MSLKSCTMRSPCPGCGSKTGLITHGSGPHLGRLSCWNCGRFQKWLGKKDYDRAVAKNLVNSWAEIEAIAG